MELNLFLDYCFCYYSSIFMGVFFSMKLMRNFVHVTKKIYAGLQNDK